MLQTYKACFASKFQGKIYQLSSKCPRPKQKKRRSEKKRRIIIRHLPITGCSIDIVLTYHLFIACNRVKKDSMGNPPRGLFLHFNFLFIAFEKKKNPLPNLVTDFNLYIMAIWVVEFSNKIRRFLPKNQHTHRKLLNF